MANTFKLFTKIMTINTICKSVNRFTRVKCKAYK